MYFIINTVMFNQTYINKNENQMKNTDKKLKNRGNSQFAWRKKRKGIELHESGGP